MQCGLLGTALSHSYSPKIHKLLGDYPYNLYEVAPEKLGDFLNYEPFTGVNITMPYKKDAIAYCGELTPAAKLLGAVNTVIRQDGGKLIGHNTDYFGFRSMVARSGLEMKSKKVLVLGSGGASATVVAVLKELGANVHVISRSGKNNYDNLEFHTDARLIVNTTPVGMYPNTGISPVDLSMFPSLDGVLDIVYNPRRTELLMQAEKLGIVAENGLWMLVAQAKESAQWFTGKEIPDSAIEEIYKRLQNDTANLVLIGMPGCGKSTVGTLLAEKTGKRFVDTDQVIEETAGISVPEIFATFGEEYFRKLETDVLHRLGMESGLVIATGGGCVTIPENYASLHQNGTIIWLKRDIQTLPIEGRPLSHKDSLQKMYTRREPLYQAFADMVVDNNGCPEDATAQILSALDKGDVL